MGQSDTIHSQVFVTDDDRGVRESLGALFDAVGQAHTLYPSGDALLSEITPEDAGCILLDYAMPGRNGMETLGVLRDRGISLPVIMITAHGDVSLAVEALKAGATDFVEKPWDKGILLNIVDRAVGEDRDRRSRNEARRAAKAAIQSFTPRERQVFEQLITGASNKVIARALDLSPRTVEFYRANVLEKSEATSVAELVRLAFLAEVIAN